MVGCTVSEAEIDKLEAQLLAKRQAKQISVSITLGLMTIVFLDSIYILSTVLHAIEGTEIFLYLLIFTVFAVGGAFALGTLARYAFIRHLKRVQADIHRIELKRILKRRHGERCVRPNHALVHLHGMSCEPLPQRLRA